MLSSLNINSRQSTTVPRSWRDKQRVLEIITAVTARHGFGALTLDNDDPTVADAELIEGYGASTPEESVIVSGSVETKTGE